MERYGAAQAIGTGASLDDNVGLNYQLINGYELRPQPRTGRAAVVISGRTRISEKTTFADQS